LIKEDISQMGVKAWGQVNSGVPGPGGSENSYTIHNVAKNNPEIYWNASSTPRDLSSYDLTHNKQPDGTFRDKIVFLKAAFDNNGLFTGIRKIEWEAKSDNKLFRTCTTIKGTQDAECSGTTILMAENIKNFNIIPSKPGNLGNDKDTLFGKNADPNFKLLSRKTGVDIKDIPDENIKPITGGTAITVSGFAQNDKTTGSTPGKDHNELYLAKTGSDWNDCEKLTFQKDETYLIEFNMPLSPDFATDDVDGGINSTQFIPGRDHLAIGLRKNSGDPIPNAPPDILFYPAQSNDASDLARRLEFSVADTVKAACIVITMAYYSPKTSDGDGKYVGSEIQSPMHRQIFYSIQRNLTMPATWQGVWNSRSQIQ